MPRQWHALVPTSANKVVHMRRDLFAEQPAFREQQEEGSLRCFGVRGLSKAPNKAARQDRIILI